MKKSIWKVEIILGRYMPIAQYIAPSKLKIVESPMSEIFIKFNFLYWKKKILTIDDMILEREICRLNLRKLYA